MLGMQRDSGVSPAPLLHYRPEHPVSGCRLWMLFRLRAATPTWMESGRLLHMDKQFLLFLSSPAKSWLMLHLARFIPSCVGTAEICCWRRKKPDRWNTSALSLTWSEVLCQLETIFIAQQSAVQIIQQVCSWGICSLLLRWCSNQLHRRSPVAPGQRC